jgi:hypothetical protein
MDTNVKLQNASVTYKLSNDWRSNLWGDDYLTEVTQMPISSMDFDAPDYYKLEAVVCASVWKCHEPKALV